MAQDFKRRRYVESNNPSFYHFTLLGELADKIAEGFIKLSNTNTFIFKNIIGQSYNLEINIWPLLVSFL
jgi:hypothetical protein